jgi:hypothetical protein
MTEGAASESGWNVKGSRLGSIKVNYIQMNCIHPSKH